MNESAAARWSTRRQIGRSKFLVQYCILGIGLPIAVILTLMEYILVQDVRWELAVVRVLLFPVLSILFGMAYWDTRERKYLDFQKAHPNSSKS